MDPQYIAQTRCNATPSPKLSAQEEALKQEWEKSGVLKSYIEYCKDKFEADLYRTGEAKTCYDRLIQTESDSDEYKALKAQAIYARLLNNIDQESIREFIDRLKDLAATCLKAKELFITLCFRCRAASEGLYSDPHVRDKREIVFNNMGDNDRSDALRCYFEFLQQSTDNTAKSSLHFFIGFILFRASKSHQEANLSISILQKVDAKNSLWYPEAQFYLGYIYQRLAKIELNTDRRREKEHASLLAYCNAFYEDPTSFVKMVAPLEFVVRDHVTDFFSGKERFQVSNRITFMGAQAMADNPFFVMLRLWFIFKNEKMILSDKITEGIPNEYLSDVNDLERHLDRLSEYFHCKTSKKEMILMCEGFFRSYTKNQLFVKFSKDCPRFLVEVKDMLITKKYWDKYENLIFVLISINLLQKGHSILGIEKKAEEEIKNLQRIEKKIEKNRIKQEKKKQKENNNKPKAVSNQEPEKEKEKEKEVRLREDSIGSEGSSTGSNASILSTEEMARQAGVAPELINQLLEQKYGAGDIHKRNTVSVKKPKRVSVKGQGGSQKERPKSLPVFRRQLSQNDLRMQARSHPSEAKDDTFITSVGKLSQDRKAIYESINILKEEWPNVKSGNLSFKGLNGNGLDDVYQIYAGPSGAYRVLFMETKIGTLENPRSELTLLDVYRKKSDEMPKEQKETIARLAKKYRKA